MSIKTNDFILLTPHHLPHLLNPKFGVPWLSLPPSPRLFPTSHTPPLSSRSELMALPLTSLTMTVTYHLHQSWTTFSQYLLMRPSPCPCWPSSSTLTRSFRTTSKFFRRNFWARRRELIYLTETGNLSQLMGIRSQSLPLRPLHDTMHMSLWTARILSRKKSKPVELSLTRKLHLELVFTELARVSAVQVLRHIFLLYAKFNPL